MKIVNLIENTEGTSGCTYMHGLSFYIETEKHKLVFDLGPAAATLENAEKLGIDLTGVDTAVLSHGHYDHSGGIIPFVKLNPRAVIYMQQTAGGDYYADDGESGERERFRYIGIDKEILRLPQIRLLSGDCVIDDELELFTVKNRTHELPSSNRKILKKEAGRLVRDDFKHEQFLVIRSGERRIVLSGCAHNGILSVMDAYMEKYGAAPDVVIGGFHLKKKTEFTDTEIREITDIAEALKKYPTQFITCHCTGVPAYETMKEIMGEQLRYVHSGEEILPPPSGKPGFDI